MSEEKFTDALSGMRKTPKAEPANQEMKRNARNPYFREQLTKEKRKKIKEYKKERKMQIEEAKKKLREKVIGSKTAEAAPEAAPEAAEENTGSAAEAAVAEGSLASRNETAPKAEVPAKEEEADDDLSAHAKQLFKRFAAFVKNRRIKHKEKKARKKELKKRKKPRGRFITPLIILGILLGCVGGCLWNIDYCKKNFDINFYHVESVRVSAEIRVVVISDVHLSEYGKNNDDLVEAIEALHPDLIISAGDLVTYGEKNYDSMLSLCERLAGIAPFFGIMGNHEDEKVYLEHDEELREKFKATGMVTLVNKCVDVRIKNNNIELVGVSGGIDEYDQYGGKDTMDNLDASSIAYRICCAHVPTLFTERLESYRFDLGIAGHTHGGIIRLPVVGGLYSAEEGFFPKFDGGLYELKNGATLFVSKGLGNSGKVPRMFNTPELAVIDIKWY